MRPDQSLYQKRHLPKDLQGATWLATQGKNHSQEWTIKTTSGEGLLVPRGGISTTLPGHRAYTSSNDGIVAITDSSQSLVLLSPIAPKLLYKSSGAIGTPKYCSSSELVYFVEYCQPTQTSFIKRVALNTHLNDAELILTLPGFIFELTEIIQDQYMCLSLFKSQDRLWNENELLTISKVKGKWTIITRESKKDTLFWAPHLTLEGHHLCFIENGISPKESQLVIRYLKYSKSVYLAPPQGEWGYPNYRSPRNLIQQIGDQEIVALSTHYGKSFLHRISFDMVGDTTLNHIPLAEDHISDFSTDFRGSTPCILRGVVSSWQTPTSIKNIPLSLTTLHTDSQNAPLHLETKTGDKSSYTLFYPPKSVANPPLIMLIHNGPNHHVSREWQDKAKYFTSRNFAVAYINYPGSTGYGRKYLNSSNGQFHKIPARAIKDTVTHLGELGLIEPKKVILWGGGFGGYLVLQTMALYPSLAKAGISVYPILDLDSYSMRTTLDKSEHLERLFGKATGHQWHKASPMNYAHRINNPILLVQGENGEYSTAEAGQKFYNKICHIKKSRHILFPEESDNFCGSKTWTQYYNSIETFLDECIETRHHRPLSTSPLTVPPIQK